jgi:hypothetical protein
MPKMLQQFRNDSTQWFTRTVYGYNEKDARDEYGRSQDDSKRQVYCVYNYRTASDYMDMWHLPEDHPVWRCEEFGEFGREYVREHKSKDPFYLGRQTLESVEQDWLRGCKQEEIRSMSSKLRSKAEGMIVSRKRKRRYNAVVGEVDADRWANRQYDQAFVDRPRTGSKGVPIVTVLAQFGGNCGIDHEALQWNGVAAVALCDALTSSGWSVGLHMFAAHQSNHDRKVMTLHCMPMKRPEDMLNLGMVGAMACHPSTYRDHMFRQYQGLDWVKPGRAHGTPFTMARFREEHSTMFDRLRDTMPGNTIVLESSYSERAAEQHVTEALEIIKNPMILG